MWRVNAWKERESWPIAFGVIVPGILIVLATILIVRGEVYYGVGVWGRATVADLSTFRTMRNPWYVWGHALRLVGIATIFFSWFALRHVGRWRRHAPAVLTAGIIVMIAGWTTLAIARQVL